MSELNRPDTVSVCRPLLGGALPTHATLSSHPPSPPPAHPVPSPVRSACAGVGSSGCRGGTRPFRTFGRCRWRCRRRGPGLPGSGPWRCGRAAAADPAGGRWATTARLGWWRRRRARSPASSGHLLGTTIHVWQSRGDSQVEGGEQHGWRVRHQGGHGCVRG